MLNKKFQSEIKPKILQELKIANPMAVPRLIKIVVNVGLGEALLDKKVIEKVSGQLAVITGQKPAPTRSKRSIANFKLRSGEVIGLKVTLRGKRMYDFFEKLVRVVLSRVRDFRGVSRTGFDGRGNYTLGISEQTVFPEIEYSQIDKARGLEVTFVTSAKDTNGAQILLAYLGMPFTKEVSSQYARSKN